MPKADVTASITPKLATDLEKFFTDQLAVLEKVQTIYAANHGGKFWQGLLTPPTIPDETTKTKAPVLTAKPTDQADAWQDLFKGTDSLPPTWPAQLQIDVYDGPRGKGWTVTLVCSEGGKKQKRTWNFGEERERDSKDWLEEKDNAIPKLG